MLLMTEGFDKYGGPNSNASVVAGLLTAGEWTSAGSTAFTVVAGLSATGYALLSSGAGVTLTKTLAANYTRLIGGIRFSASLAAAAGLTFLDSASSQASISINSTGTVSVRNAGITGTVLGTSASSITANTPHYLEWDVTFGNAAAYQVWMDGVSILSGSGDTTATANAFANGVSFLASGSAAFTIDDLYLFDTTGTTNNAVLLTSPRIETQFPSGDSAVQFAVGAGIVGSSTLRVSANTGNSANVMRLRAIIPPAACTLTAVAFQAGSTASASVVQRPLVYADSSGVPGALLSTGSTVTGITASATKVMPLTSGVALSAGTRYWIGHMNDISISSSFAQLSSVSDDLIVAATFASGAPATAPAMTTQPGSVIWGVVTGLPNWATTAINPPQGNLSYVYEATVGEADLYSFPALSVTPSAIYAVAVKASVTKSDAGAKTASVRLKSGATDSAGTGGTQAPGTSYAWVTSLYPTDPNTSAAWTLAALNAAQAGVKVDS